MRRHDQRTCGFGRCLLRSDRTLSFLGGLFWWRSSDSFWPIHSGSEVLIRYFYFPGFGNRVELAGTCFEGFEGTTLLCSTKEKIVPAKGGRVSPGLVVTPAG